MNVVARLTTRALEDHGVQGLPNYRRMLTIACNERPPPFGRKEYGELFRASAADPQWMALSLATNSQSEGEGSQHLWDLAASTRDTDIARQIQHHAIDESRHSRTYVALLELIFSVDESLATSLRQLSPGYTRATPLIARKGSPFAHPATVDELIQMNIAEIRTRIHQLLQRPVLLAYCRPDRRAQVRRILDALLVDETRHVAYTARLIERAAEESGVAEVVDLMRERVRDFNEITDDEIARRSLNPI
jgi:hypothetical protein